MIFEEDARERLIEALQNRGLHLHFDLQYWRVVTGSRVMPICKTLRCFKMRLKNFRPATEYDDEREAVP